MSDEPIRNRIAALGAQTEAETSLLMWRTIQASWPGGSEDRNEPGAVEWLRRWRPERSGVTFPVCCCAHGVCSICN